MVKYVVNFPLTCPTNGVYNFDYNAPSKKPTPSQRRTMTRCRTRWPAHGNNGDGEVYLCHLIMNQERDVSDGANWDSDVKAIVNNRAPFLFVDMENNINPNNVVEDLDDPPDRNDIIENLPNMRISRVLQT